MPLCLSVTTRRTQEPIARGAAFGAEVVPKEWTGAGAKSHKATNGYDELPSAMRPRPPENGDGDGPRTRGRARCHLCELAYCERTIAEPPETTDLIRFCPPLHPFVSESASYGKVAQMVFSWGRASANNYLDSHRPRDGRVLTDLQVLTGLGMCYDPNNCWQTHRRPFEPPAHTRHSQIQRVEKRVESADSSPSPWRGLSRGWGWGVRGQGGILHYDRMN